MALYYNIANLRLEVVGQEVEQALHLMDCMRPFECNACEAVCHIQFHQSSCRLIDNPEGLLKEFDFSDCLQHCRFGNHQGTYWFEMTENEGDNMAVQLIYKGQDLIEVVCTKITTQIRFVLWMAYSLVGMKFNRVPVHASCTVYEQQAVMFLGESGTGKSTHSRMWLENIPNTMLLNDDSPILCIEESQVMVYGSPWSGKTPCYKQMGFPLAAIVRIEQAPANSIQKMRTLEALICLHPSCPPALAKDEYYLDLMMQWLSEVLKTTPVYKLKCLPDADAARLCNNTLFNH